MAALNVPCGNRWYLMNEKALILAIAFLVTDICIGINVILLLRTLRG